MYDLKIIPTLLFTLLLIPGLALAANTEKSDTRAMPPSYGPDTQIFDNPRYAGSAVDKCLYSRGDRQCGKPAADRFCELQGYRESISYDLIERAGNTFLLGSESKCRGSSCDAFRAVACTHRTGSGGGQVPDRLYKTPEHNGSPISECLRQDRDCGSKAANRFCRDNKHGYAASFRVEGSQQRTWLLGDARYCTGKDCKALQYIRCESGNSDSDNGFFAEPSYKGKRISRCVAQGKQCGQRAADEFCILNGYRSASKYERWRNAGPTIRIGSGQMCNKQSCDSLKNIQCSYDPPKNSSGNQNQKTFANPTHKGYPIARCVNRGETCDQDAVDVFCRMNGYREAIAWQPAEDIGPTVRLGNEQLCNKRSCDGFRDVVCKR